MWRFRLCVPIPCLLMKSAKEIKAMPMKAFKTLYSDFATTERRIFEFPLLWACRIHIEGLLDEVYLTIDFKDCDVSFRHSYVLCVAFTATPWFQVYELCLHYSSNPDHNIITASLETLQVSRAPLCSRCLYSS